MKEINFVFSSKAIETAKLMKEIARNSFNLKLNMYKNTTDIDLRDDNNETIYYGFGDNFDLNKDETAELIDEFDILPNTIIKDDDEIDDFDTILIKNPVRIMLYKDAKDLYETMYKFIKNKKEWRINYSWGKVNSILLKNLDGNVFGKQKNCNWLREDNRNTRDFLREITKQIADVLDLEHFGLDIIYDIDENIYYFLEVNRANGLNEEGCYYFLRGFMDKMGWYYEERNCLQQNCDIVRNREWIDIREINW